MNFKNIISLLVEWLHPTPKQVWDTQLRDVDLNYFNLNEVVSAAELAAGVFIQTHGLSTTEVKISTEWSGTCLTVHIYSNSPGKLIGNGGETATEMRKFIGRTLYTELQARVPVYVNATHKLSQFKVSVV